jgi:epoxyqueuosine reductase
MGIPFAVHIPLLPIRVAQPWRGGIIHSVKGLASFVAPLILQQVAQARTETRYRPPLVGFADAADPRFRQLRQLAEPQHLLPTDLLPGARSVIAFFLPFAPEVVEANRTHRREIAPAWALAYVETNELIKLISRQLVNAFAQRGFQAATEPPTHNFDPTTLVSRWSHKSVAAIAGLGSFGLHHMLITSAGCAGRFGSVVVDAVLEPTSPPAGPLPHRCKYWVDGSCTVCIDRCPVGALTVDGLDKQLCNRWLLCAAGRFKAIGTADVCGKCATGPCALAPCI